MRLLVVEVGESLFNDRVGVVVFAFIYHIVTNGTANVSTGSIDLLFVEEAGEGVLFGLVLSYGMNRQLRTFDHYQTEVILTVAGVMGLSAGAKPPRFGAAAGLLVSDKTRHRLMSAVSEDYIDKFWELIDGLMNALLFILMGVEQLLIMFQVTQLTICLLMILLVLLARYLAILIWFTLARPRR
ncbi:cation:proton antiporter domain-containing protein [Spirosoma arcticum]